MGACVCVCARLCVCVCVCVCEIEIQQVGNRPDETESPISPLSKRKVAPSTLVSDIDLCVCVCVCMCVWVRERERERETRREREYWSVWGGEEREGATVESPKQGNKVKESGRERDIKWVERERERATEGRGKVSQNEGDMKDRYLMI